MKKFTRFATALLALVLLISAFPISAFAAANWPSLSESGYCEMVAPMNLNVYKDSSLKTRGTASPAKAYNASISKNDLLYIYKINGTCVYLSYPTAQGRRLGYCSTAQLFGVTAPKEVITAKVKVTTYKSASTASRSGSVAVNDKVYKLGTTSSGFALVIYPARSGARGYKAAFVTKSDYEKMNIGSGSNNANSGSQKMSYALYKGSGYISCGFDGYSSTSGRHEGIDFVKGRGSAVYSLTDGVITRVTEGARGSSGLSTIAIYNAASDKTIIYLHADPLNSLKVGQKISRGQQIATEDWRGLSASSKTHTHVEVRSGRRTAAAKSVGDSVLNNFNPTSFWQSQGYTVK